MKNEAVQASNEVEFIALLAQVKPEDMAGVLAELHAIASQYQR